MKFFGIDWATDLHDVGLLDDQGAELESWQVAHTAAGLTSLLEHLREQGGPPEILVGMESGAALLLSSLTEAGYTVYVLNPKQSDRYRDRHSVAGAKDDRLDWKVCADAVRTDRGRLRAFEPDSPLAQELRLRDRARTRLVETRAAMENQLRQTVAEYFPVLLELGRPMNDLFFLALLRFVRDPERARGVRLSSLQRLIQEHRLRSLEARALREKLRAPSFAVTAPVLEARRDEALRLAHLLEEFNGQIAQAEDALDELAKKHPDHELLQSLPGVGSRLAVRVMAELGDSEARRADPSTLQTYAGTAPVTRRSGKSGRAGCSSVRMRRGCNRTLQAALFTIARASVATSPWAAAFLEHRLRGRKYGRTVALRTLSNKWARIMWALLTTRQTYDEARHTQDLTRAGVPWAPAGKAAA